MSIREGFLSRENKKFQEVSLDDPCWGVEKLYVKLMNGRERLAFQQRATKMVGSEEAKVVSFIIIHTVFDADGNPVFTDEDTEAILSYTGTDIDKLFAVSTLKNGFFEKGVEAAKKN